MASRADKREDAMSINHLHDACGHAAGQLDAILDEAELEQDERRCGDVYELVELAQACLEAAGRIADDTDGPLGNGEEGLVQLTKAALRGEPAPDGLAFDAIGQIVTMVQAERRVAS
jgi:hypothetical protein